MSKIEKVCCLGAGIIGSGWTVNFAIKGFHVNLYIRNSQKIETTKQEIEKALQYLAERGAISQNDIGASLNRINFTSDLVESLTGVQFIQENLPENYETKQAILKEIDKYADPKAIYASSTSGLLISEIAKSSSYPERCIGGHPYNPPHLIPLVEITKSDATDPELLQAGIEFYRQAGKEPVVLQKEAPGFICNRISYALYREAISLVMDGVCTIEDVDKAVTYGPGLRWAIFGPNMLYELGSTNGIGELFEKTGKMFDSVLADIADWKVFPKEYPSIAQAGVDIEKQNLPAHIGNTREGAIKFRNDVLIELLKLHRKF